MRLALISMVSRSSGCSATVFRACSDRVPKLQRAGATFEVSGAHAALASSTASSGVGVTDSLSAGFVHGLLASRAAAPKQRGVAAWAVVQATSTAATVTTSP